MESMRPACWTRLRLVGGGLRPQTPARGLRPLDPAPPRAPAPAPGRRPLMQRAWKHPTGMNWPCLVESWIRVVQAQVDGGRRAAVGAGAMQTGWGARGLEFSEGRWRNAGAFAGAPADVPSARLVVSSTAAPGSNRKTLRQGRGVGARKAGFLHARNRRLRRAGPSQKRSGLSSGKPPPEVKLSGA